VTGTNPMPKNTIGRFSVHTGMSSGATNGWIRETSFTNE